MDLVDSEKGKKEIQEASPSNPLPNALSRNPSVREKSPDPEIGFTSSGTPNLLLPKNFFANENDPIHPFIFDIQMAALENDTQTMVSIFSQIDFILEFYPELWLKYGNVFTFLSRHFKIPLAFAEREKLASRKLVFGKIPYFQDSENGVQRKTSRGSCAAAMILCGFGWKGHPDELSKEFGTAISLRPEGLALVLNLLARREKFKFFAKVHSGPLEEFKNSLKEGPVVAFPRNFPSGNVVVIKSLSGKFYRVHDPIGSWDPEERIPYDTSVRGANQKYSPTAFESTLGHRGKITWIGFERIN